MLAAVVAACGSDPSAGNKGEPPPTLPAAGWPGPAEAAPDGRLPVGDFNVYLADRAAPASPTTLALEFVRDDRRQAARTTTDAVGSPEGGGPTTVTVTLDGLADDSVRAARYVLRFAPEGDKWRLRSAVRTQRCQPGRGHETFAPEPCV